MDSGRESLQGSRCSCGHQVTSIGNLDGGWCRKTRRGSVITAAIPTDDLRLPVLGDPCRDHRGGAGRKQVDNPSPLHLEINRPGAVFPFEGDVVDAQGSWRAHRWLGQTTDQGQQGHPMDPDLAPLGKALAGSTAVVEADVLQGTRRRAERAAMVRCCSTKVRRARGVATAKPADEGVDPDRMATNGMIGHAANVAGMEMSRTPPVGWAARSGGSTGSFRNTLTVGQANLLQRKTGTVGKQGENRPR